MEDLRTDVVRTVEGLIEFNRVLQSVLEDPVESEQSSFKNTIERVVWRWVGECVCEEENKRKQSTERKQMRRKTRRKRMKMSILPLEETVRNVVLPSPLLSQ